MKTSNKIILFLFLLPAIVYTLLYVALYSKYKSRSFTVEENAPISHSLPPIHTIHLPEDNGSTATIKYASDFSIETKPKDSVQYKVENESLFVTQNKGFYTHITIYLPELTNLVTNQSNVNIESSAKFDSLFITQANTGNKSIRFAGKATYLSINDGDHTNVTIEEQAEISNIDVRLGAESNLHIAGKVEGYENIILGKKTNFTFSGENAGTFFSKKN